MSGKVVETAEGLVADVDQLLAVLDADPVSDGELNALVTLFAAVTSKLTAAQAATIEQWERRALWCSDRSRSPSMRLSTQTGCSRGTAGARLAQAHQLANMPGTRAALTAGDVSTDHLRLLTKARSGREELFERDEALLVGFCRDLTVFEDVKQAVAYWCQRVDAEGCEDEARDQFDKAHVHCSQTLFGNYRLDGQLDPLRGEIFTTELARLTNQIRLNDLRDGVEPTPAQRRAAALVLMAERSASGGDESKARVVLTVHVGTDTLTTLCQTASGTVTTPGQLIPYLHRSEIDTILFDTHNTVLAVTDRESFSTKVKRAVKARDLRCQHPSGCDRPAVVCDVDHIRPRADGGLGHQYNGRLLCAIHNRDASRRDRNPAAPPARHIDEHDALKAVIRYQTMRCRWPNAPDRALTPQQIDELNSNAR